MPIVVRAVTMQVVTAAATTTLVTESDLLKNDTHHVCSASVPRVPMSGGNQNVGNKATAGPSRHAGGATCFFQQHSPVNRSDRLHLL